MARSYSWDYWDFRDISTHFFSHWLSLSIVHCWWPFFRSPLTSYNKNGHSSHIYWTQNWLHHHATNPCPQRTVQLFHLENSGSICTSSVLCVWVHRRDSSLHCYGWRNRPAEMEDARSTCTRLHCRYHQWLSHHPHQLWLGGSGRMPLSIKSTLGEAQIHFWDHRTCWAIQFVPQGFTHQDSSLIR